MIDPMDKHIILHFFKRCKTFSQLHQVHAHMITTGLSNQYSSLISPNILCTITRVSAAAHVAGPSFSRHSIVNYAASVFNHIANPTTFCYNTMMRAQTLLSSPLSTLMLFIHMRRICIPPDFYTFPFAIKATGQLRLPSVAAALHSQTLKFGFVSDLFIFNSIVHVYAICGCLGDARLIYEENDQKDIVSQNALLDGLVKIGDITQAREFFDNMSECDAVSWGTLVAGYVQLNQFQNAINLFNEMLDSPYGICPDNIALVSVLSSCAQLGNLEQGKSVHEYIVQNRIRINSFLATGLVDLYAKCGCIETSVQLFEDCVEKNLFTWNAILVGLAVHGHGRACLDYFFRMIKDGIKPDGVSFLGVFVGCSHAGLVAEARKLFESMEAVYGVTRELKHYGCMVDLLGRAGLITEALEMIKQMPVGGDIYVWGGLIAGCRKHGLVEIAEYIAKNVQSLYPEDGGVYSVMVNIYANSDMWDNVVKTRNVIKNRKVNKIAACSSIKVNGIAHDFIAGGMLHPQTGEIYTVLNGLGNYQYDV